MRSFLFVLVAVLVVACGASSKRKVVSPTDDRAAATVSPRSTQQVPDVTLTTNTGDDLSWLHPVYFAFDSADLSRDARDTLGRLHEWLVAHPTTTLTIEGHCDEQGTTEYNVALGQRRAQAMVDYLVRLGADSKRLSAVSYGAERPASDGHDEIAWAKNRRGEFQVAH